MASTSQHAMWHIRPLSSIWATGPLVVNENDNISDQCNCDNQPDNEDLNNNVILQGLKLPRSKEEWDSVRSGFH